MEHMTVKDIVQATGGRLLCGDKNTPLLHISIDSRVMKGQDLFVPLIGEKADAHRFIEGAFAAGAAAVLTSEHDDRNDTRPWIRVENTKKALQAIGSFYRKRMRQPLVGITGSVGKTTTREMVAAALSGRFRVYKTPGNANSQVGVPITLSEMTAQDEIGVLELGMSMPGELTVIAGIANVDMALITNVGVTHIEQLGSRENIYREKLSIQDGLKKGGILFLNGDDDLLKNTVARPGYETVYYGTGQNSSYRAEDIHLERGYPVFTANCSGVRIPVHLKIMGSHNVLNAMAALAVADKQGVPLDAAVKKLEEFTGFQNRQQVYEYGGITVIDDTYNASPLSMEAGLKVLSSVPGYRRHIAVLADMKELGDNASRFHREVGEKLKDYPVHVLFTLGDLAGEIAEGAKAAGMKVGAEPSRYFHFEAEDLEGLFQALAGELRAGDCVFLKGSNSMRLGGVAAKLLSLLQEKTES